MAPPRAYWKGSLKLSLVTCPVVLYPASTTVEKTKFHLINRDTGNRLKQQMVDSETGDVVEKDQKGRGYEISKGEYIEIEKEELDAVQMRAITLSTSTTSSPATRSIVVISTTLTISRLTERPAPMPSR